MGFDTSRFSYQIYGSILARCCRRLLLGCSLYLWALNYDNGSSAEGTRCGKKLADRENKFDGATTAAVIARKWFLYGEVPLIIPSWNWWFIGCLLSPLARLSSSAEQLGFTELNRSFANRPGQNRRVQGVRWVLDISDDKPTRSEKLQQQPVVLEADWMARPRELAVSCCASPEAMEWLGDAAKPKQSTSRPQPPQPEGAGKTSHRERPRCWWNACCQQLLQHEWKSGGRIHRFWLQEEGTGRCAFKTKLKSSKRASAERQKDHQRCDTANRVDCQQSTSIEASLESNNTKASDGHAWASE